jgi:hypothetical protein
MNVRECPIVHHIWREEFQREIATTPSRMGSRNDGSEGGSRNDGSEGVSRNDSWCRMGSRNDVNDKVPLKGDPPHNPSFFIFLYRCERSSPNWRAASATLPALWSIAALMCVRSERSIASFSVEASSVGIC